MSQGDDTNRNQDMKYLLPHFLTKDAEYWKDKEALVHADQRLSYKEVLASIIGLAEGLCGAGVVRGDRVGILLEMSIPQAIAIFGVSQAGAVFVPVNTTLVPRQVAHVVRDCGMKGLITTADRLESLRPALGELTSLEFVFLVGREECWKDLDFLLPCYSFQRACELPAARMPPDAGTEKDLAAILYTSGSTGKPKGVMLTHAQIMAGASIVSDYLNISQVDRTLCVLPFTFDAGLNQIMTAFQQRATAVIINFTFAKDVVHALERERITGLAGVPTFWSLVAQRNSPLHKQSWPHLRYITNTGGAMPRNLLALLREALPETQVFLMYGLTEAFRSTYLPPDELDRRPTSIGKAIPNTEILVLNEQGERCAFGEAGELVHRGPTVSLGYWGNPEATAQVLRPNPLAPKELGTEERVCFSGDIVKQDEEGFLYFVGRRDAMIKSSGYRISPTEVEETLFSSGKVQLAAVIGLPDELLGQVIKAFVVLNKANAASTEDLIAYCAEQLPRYMVPKFLEILDEMPVTSSRKVDYPALRRREGV